MKASLSVQILLPLEAIEKLRLPVNGRGGFQSLLRTLQTNIAGGDLLVLTPEMVGRIANYVNRYGCGGFQGRLEPILNELRELAKLLEPMAA